MTDTTYPVTDMIGQEIMEGDFVVFYSNIYRVKTVGDTKNNSGNGMVRMKIIGHTKPKYVTRSKSSKEMCKLDQNQVLIWLLKHNYEH